MGLDFKGTLRIFGVSMREVKCRPPQARVPTWAYVRGRLTKLLHEICSVPEELLTDEASIDSELRVESVQLAQIQVALEEEFDIEIDFLEVIRLRRLGPITDYLYDCARTSSATDH